MANERALKNANTKSETSAVSVIKRIFTFACVIFTFSVISLYSLQNWADALPYLSPSTMLALLAFSVITAATAELKNLKFIPHILCLVIQFVIFIVSFHIAFFTIPAKEISDASMLIGDTLVAVLYVFIRSIYALIVSKVARK